MIGTRRRFLTQTGFLAASGFGVASSRAGRAETVAPPPVPTSAGPPRHIIHLVADGMSHGTLTLGDYFSRLSRQRSLRWFDLCRWPGATTAFVNMRSLNSVVTDSAAASSSWGSGSRVVNGVLNQLPDGRDLRPLYSLFDEAGWKRGLVTTTEITHATPAGFVANCSSRGNAEDIARQYLDRRIDVLLGGGRQYFDPAKRADKRDLPAEYRAQGYVVIEKAADLDQAPADRRWLGTFASGHLPFTLDHWADSKLLGRIPTLARMTEQALRRLEPANHFILQVEGGRVDHGAHSCDIATAVRDLVAFDEALEVCLEFQRRTPETLVVVTTDHGTANPGLNGTGSGYKESTPLFANVLRASRSFEAMESELRQADSIPALQRVLEAGTGYRVPEAKATLFRQILDKQVSPIYDQMNSAGAQLGQLMANHLGVGWTGTAHTADYVPLVAIGPGAERFRGFLQNTDLFAGYLALAGIDYRNPEAPLMAECGPSAAAAEAAGRLA